MQEQVKMNADENQIVVYQPNETVRLDVRLENDYDLSINKYKIVEYVAEKFPPVSEIMAEFEKTEREIASVWEELKESLYANAKGGAR